MARQRQAVRVRPDQPFKGRQFTAEVILWAVRWYLMFPISYRDLMMAILWDRMPYLTPLLNTEIISLDQAPEAYKVFQEGSPKKFVIDPHGSVKRAA